jgi:hypothetical protein
MLALTQLIWVHPQTHGATRGAPLKTRGGKLIRQALGFCLSFD